MSLVLRVLCHALEWSAPKISPFIIDAEHCPMNYYMKHSFSSSLRPFLTFVMFAASFLMMFWTACACARHWIGIK
jgi:hypothetical protein